MNLKEVIGLFYDEGMPVGRKITVARKAYCLAKPQGNPVWDAHVYVGGVKVWMGDLDLAEDHVKLTRIAGRINQSVHVLKKAEWENRDLYMVWSVA